jgi:HAD superfamily hydrolase (TIGR01490 family)
MTRATTPIAAFDFDGTITDRDTLLPFLYRVAGPASLSRALAASLARARMDDRRNEMKSVVLQRVFAGRSSAEIKAAGAAYARQLETKVRPAMREQIEWHRQEGHRIVIVSASLHTYLDPLAHYLGVDGVLAVALEEDDRGRLTGDIVGANTRGPEKVVKLRAWAGDQPDELWAYGDASGDAHLLRAATHPMPVTRRAHRVISS